MLEVGDALEVLSAKSYYEVLNLPSTATQSEIAKAFRNRCLQLHPDRRCGEAGATRGDADKAFLLVAEANTWLSDTDRRRVYDVVYHGRGVDAEQKVRELAPTIGAGGVAQTGLFASQAAELLRVALSSVSLGGPAVPQQQHHCSSGCGATVELHGLQCRACFQRPVGKAGRCSTLGCFELLTSEGCGGKCVKCVNKPRKCKQLGCLTMTKTTTGFCERHAPPLGEA